MANYVRMSDQAIRQITQDARNEPPIIPRRELVQIIKCFAQWRIPIKPGLTLLDPITVEREQQWRQDRNQHGYAIRLRRPPQWAELTVAAATGSVEQPDEWLGPKTGDPERNIYWTENYVLIQRDSRWFAPCCNGGEYFSDTQMQAIEALSDPAIIQFLDKEDIPAQPEPV